MELGSGVVSRRACNNKAMVYNRKGKRQKTCRAGVYSRSVVVLCVAGERECDVEEDEAGSGSECLSWLGKRVCFEHISLLRDELELTEICRTARTDERTV